MDTCGNTPSNCISYTMEHDSGEKITIYADNIDVSQLYTFGGLTFKDKEEYLKYMNTFEYQK